MPSVRRPSLTPAGVKRALLRFLHPAQLDNAPTDLPPATETASLFYSVVRPAITPVAYVDRLFRYSHCAESVYIYAVVLLRRAALTDPKLLINAFNINRLLITAILVAAKTVDGVFFPNDFYQRVGGVATLREMNRLELAFLRTLAFRVFVTPEELFDTYIELLDDA